MNPFDGKLNKVVSKGSHSREFIDANFRGGSFHDTVYVTANAKAWDVDDSTFYNMIRTYGQEQRNRDDQSRYRAYSPEVVYDIACSAYEQHQDKRLIVHFMQPHAPYFGTNAMKLREELRYKYDIAFNAWDSKEKINESEEEFKYLLKVAKKKDYISAQELYDVYIENLEYVFTYVKRLLDKLEGKTVITADHGELLGFTQNRLIGLTNINRYEHPKGVHIPELCFVPWLIIESDKRRKIMAHDPIETGDITQEQVDEQLEALGYK